VGSISIEIDDKVFIFDLCTVDMMDRSSLGDVDNWPGGEAVVHSRDTIGIELGVSGAGVGVVSTFGITDVGLGVDFGVSSVAATLVLTKKSSAVLSSSRIFLLLDATNDDSSNALYRDGKWRDRSCKDGVGRE
jgi:hypothetical protein